MKKVSANRGWVYTRRCSESLAAPVTRAVRTRRMNMKIGHLRNDNAEAVSTIMSKQHMKRANSADALNISMASHHRDCVQMRHLAWEIGL